MKTALGVLFAFVVIAVAAPFDADASTAIGWHTFPNMPSDNDRIQFDESGHASAPGKIKFTLRCTVNNCWAKEIKVYSSDGHQLGDIQVDGAHPGPVSVEFDRSSIAFFELCKAKTFGVMTGMYSISSLDGKQGKELSFTWTRDG